MNFSGKLGPFSRLFLNGLLPRMTLSTGSKAQLLKSRQTLALQTIPRMRWSAARVKRFHMRSLMVMGLPPRLRKLIDAGNPHGQSHRNQA